ncbi:MAG: hypothetical protein HOW73_43000 [Polyangiaceae bacterium]|nr:hypothetical protein [Polyangiaceae bacterium]
MDLDESRPVDIWQRDLLDRIEYVCALACADHDAGFEDGCARAALLAHLSSIVGKIRWRFPRDPLPLAHEVRVASSAEEKVDAIEHIVSSLVEEPGTELYVAALAARATVRAGIEHREAALALGGDPVWIPSGCVRALVLFALSRLRRVARALFASAESRTDRGRSQGSPFRTAAVVEDSARAALDVPRVERHLQRALVLTAVFDAWNKDAAATEEANPFGLGNPHAREVFTTVRRSAIDQLTHARRFLVRLADPALACGALAIEVIEAFSMARFADMTPGMPRATALLDELSASLTAAFGLEGSPRNLLTLALHHARRRMAAPSPAMATALESLVFMIAMGRAPRAFEIEWPYCDDYFLASIVAPPSRPSRSWLDYLNPSAPANAARSQWQALRDRVASAYPRPPTNEDYDNALVFREALDRSPAGVYFAIPSLRRFIDAMRSTELDDLSTMLRHADSGDTSRSAMHLVLDEWGKLVARSITPICPSGQMLERYVEMQLFGTCAPWPQPPTHASPY